VTTKTVSAWLATNIAVLVLYTVVPPIFLNTGSDRIVGMPEMLFWFTLLPLVIPALMAALYLYDRSVSRPARQASQASRVIRGEEQPS
jgi:uncharacterized membrane protein SirB2